MIKCIYFSESGGDNAAGEAAMLSAHRFLGMDIKDADEVRLQFEAVDGSASESTVDLTHEQGLSKDVMLQAGATMLADKHFIVIQAGTDLAGNVGQFSDHLAFGPDLITDVTFTA